MFEIATVYVGTAAVMGVSAVAFVAVANGMPPTARRFGFVAVVPAVSMALAYLAMAGDLLLVETTGGDQSVARFIGYTASWGAIAYAIGAVAGTGRNRTLTLFGFLVLALWGSFAGWLVEGALELAATGVTVGSLVVVTYLLLGPFERAASRVSGDRTLLYGKLKFLLLLAWAALAVISVTSEQNLAMLDTFVGQLVASYVDVILIVGFGGFVLRDAGAIEETIRGAKATTAASDPTGDPA